MAKKKRKQKPEERIKRNGVVPFDVRVRIIQAVMRGTRQTDVAVAFGVSVAAITKFVAMFESGGMDALRVRPTGAVAKQRRENFKVPRDEVVALRETNPEWGTRRIRDVLARFEGLGVSETTVRRILHEEGLLVEREHVEPRDKPVRRFERAEPNQLWQTDIFTFELRRHRARLRRRLHGRLLALLGVVGDGPSPEVEPGHRSA